MVPLSPLLDCERLSSLATVHLRNLRRDAIMPETDLHQIVDSLAGITTGTNYSARAAIALRAAADFPRARQHLRPPA